MLIETLEHSGDHLFAFGQESADFDGAMKMGINRRIGVIGYFWLTLFIAARSLDADEANAEALKSGTAFLNYGEPKFLAGAIYSPNPNRLLFNFNRVVKQSGSTIDVQREFSYPDGRVAAREHVIYEGDRLVSYELNEVQVGARGTATIRHTASDGGIDNIEFEYSSSPGIRPRLHTEPSQPNTMVADMLGAWLAAQWGPLERGDKVKCRLIVVPLTGTVGFTFVKDCETSQGNQQVLIVKMEPTSAFISVLVRPLFFTMEKSPHHRILQCSGRTIPKIRLGESWKELDAITVFDWPSAR